ncbi:MAG TPA: nucleotidyltransferase family protein [Pyrinomonadaceae bacterium]
MTTPNEQSLLLCIARRDLDDARTTELHRLLQGPIDWNDLIETACQHRLIPLLHRHLSAVQTDVRLVELERIRREALENSQSVLYLITQLRTIINSFDEERVPLLVFKGPILAQLAYGEISLRQSGDLDLLIDRSHFNRVRSILESLGFQMAPPLTTSQQTAHLGFHCEIQFMRDNRFTVVDLHWSLTPKAFPFFLSTEELMDRAQSVSLAGVAVRTFAVEDMILFQSMHGAKHHWLRLEWISSLAEIIRANSQIDWTVLIERARVARGVKMLALGMHLAQGVGDVDIPADVFREIDQDGMMKRVAAERIAELFRPQRREYRSVQAVRENLKIMDRKRDVFASLLRALFVPTISDWETLTLPGSLHLLYYVLRPFRLAGRYAVAVWQTLTSRVGFQTNAASKIR